jgi:hypothetical protein
VSRETIEIDSLSPSTIVFPALGGIPGQVEIEKLIKTLKIENTDDLHLSSLFLIFSLELRKKKTLKLK